MTDKDFEVGTQNLADEAVEYCRKNGVEFYAVNKNYPEEEYSDCISRKIDADVYIDDKNIGGFPGWSAIWQMLNPDELKNAGYKPEYQSKGIFTKFLSIFKLK